MPPEERIVRPNRHRFTLPQSDSGFSHHNPIRDSLAATNANNCGEAIEKCYETFRQHEAIAHQGRSRSAGAGAGA